MAIAEEAMHLLVNDACSVKLVDDVKLPAAAAKAFRGVRRVVART